MKKINNKFMKILLILYKKEEDGPGFNEDIIKSPHIKYTGEDVKIPSVDKIVDIYEEDEKVIGKIYGVINKIAQKEGILDKGYRVIINMLDIGIGSESASIKHYQSSLYVNTFLILDLSV